jgi:hypothetical protein
MVLLESTLIAVGLVALVRLSLSSASSVPGRGCRDCLVFPTFPPDLLASRPGNRKLIRGRLLDQA